MFDVVQKTTYFETDGVFVFIDMTTLKRMILYKGLGVQYFELS